jgi:hypothetical protein
MLQANGWLAIELLSTFLFLALIGCAYWLRR